MFFIRRLCKALAFAFLPWLLPGSTLAQMPSPVTQAFSIGAYYARGDYGQPDTTKILYFPASYEFNRGKWGFQVLVPHLEVEGVGSVLVNIGGVTRAVAGTQPSTERGMGDSVATVIYRLDPLSAASPFVDLRLDIKLPTADEKRGLGSGETDYSLQVDLSRNVGNMLAFASIGYNIRGKSDLYPGLNDSAFAQLGLARALTSNWSLGVYYDFREAASDYAEETHELLPYFTWKLTERWSFTGLTAWGFTDGSADLSVLGQLSYRW